MPKSKYHKTTKQLFSCSGVWLSPVQANIEWWTTDYINTSAWTSLFRASRKRIFRWWLKHPFRESETVTSEDSASDSEASIGPILLDWVFLDHSPRLGGWWRAKELPLPDHFRWEMYFRSLLAGQVQSENRARPSAPFRSSWPTLSPDPFQIEPAHFRSSW